MKALLIFTFLLFSVATYSQKDMSIDVLGSFDYTNLTAISGLSPDDQQGVFTYRAGFNFNFRIYDKILFKTGLRYAQIGDQTLQDDLRWPSEIGPNGFEPDPSLPRFIRSTTIHRFIEVPLFLRYEINQNKLSPYVEFGVSPHLYTDTRVGSETNLTSSSMTVDYSQNIFDLKKMQFAAILGLGMNYSVADVSQVFVQPTFRYHMTEISNNPNSNRLFSFGLELGYRYLFANYFDQVKG